MLVLKEKLNRAYALFFDCLNKNYGRLGSALIGVVLTLDLYGRQGKIIMCSLVSYF